MRLIRLGQQPSGVTADVRSALTAVGRGATVVGGVALLGARAPDGRPVDAVVFVPHGILVVSAVTLPGPALRLDAPLGGQWRADGWAVETGTAAVNPAGEALELAGHVAERLRALHPAGAAAQICTIVAVGPYVEHVEQPATELADNARVLYPTTTSMLSATVSMPRANAPLTVADIRTFLAALAPDAALPGDDSLFAEGFAAAPPQPPTPAPAPAPEPTGRYLSAIESTVPTAPPSSAAASTGPEPSGAESSGPESPLPTVAEPSPTDSATGEAPAVPVTTPQGPAERPPAPDANRSRRKPRRWLVPAVLTLLGCLLVAGAVTTMVRSNGSDPPPRTDQSSTTQPPPTQVGGLAFTRYASAATDKCAHHAYGDLRVTLEDGDCLQLHRASFTARVDGKTAATTVAVLRFPDRAAAEDFRDLAQQPGTGGIRDIAAQRDKWPTDTPLFSGAASVERIHKATVHLIRTGWLDKTSRSDDTELERTAEAALQLPLPE